MAKPQRTRKPRGGKGRSKAEDVTGAKEGAVEVRKPVGVGDNSKLKLPAPADFDHHFKSLRGAKDKVDTARQIERQAAEAANKVFPGLSKICKQMMKIQDENDPVKLQQFLDLYGLGLKQINSPIQITIFDTLAGDVGDQAYKRGFADGEAGRSANNQYPAGSDLHEEYQRGWSHGTAKNLDVSPEQSDEALAGGDAESGEDEEETEIPDAA